MTIYTKKGDRGETGLPGSRRLSKTDSLFEFLGSLDETNAQVGLALSYLKDDAPSLMLLEIQRNFLGIGACLASVNPALAPIVTKLSKQTQKLEKTIDGWDKIIKPLENFILPGGTTAAATLHICRTSIRTTERAFHRLDNRNDLPTVSEYLNRLSDFFFQAARFINHQNGAVEEIWKQ
jgi:cob(I)alamin adenosyltransferase